MKNFPALFCAEISFNAKFSNQIVPEALANTINAALSAAFFMSFATTLVTTVLIAFRIYTVTKRDGLSSRRFKHVMDIVIQPGAVYALSQFTAAMAGEVPGSATLNPRNIAFDD
ncbi:hypothetical protein BDN70DRAFT_937278 [Pholiota conissans]|uniref:Uncharacterized protein n=1 Tax=Pholiota conissans TaxID=109636 RepID=A0A9P5YPS5_9AGAR|nr:hypothetical protein BDN70DRAFT_937278 [Pholiota conissans]